MPFHSKALPNDPCETVYQLRGVIAAPDTQEAALARVIDLIQPFIAKLLYVKLPDEAKDHQSYEITGKDSRCECISIPERLLWAVRFSFSAKDKTYWFYDIAITEEGGELLFGLKIDAGAGTDVSAAQSRLPLVDKLLAEVPLAQSRPVKDNLWLIEEPGEIENLVALLTSPHRSLPVIVISAVSWKQWTFTPSPPGYLVNAAYLAPRVKGYAYVVQLGFRAAFEFSERAGRVWSVYNGACRTYFPHVDFDNGVPAQHRCNHKDSIWYWKYNNQQGPNAYTSFLIDFAHRMASTNRINWQGLYFIPDAQILQSELALAHANHVANAPARELALQNHVTALQRKLDTASEEESGWLTELEKAQEAAEYYKQENTALRFQLDVMRSHLTRQSGVSPDNGIALPDNYRDMGDWVRQNLAGRLVLLPRAERAAAKADYSQVSMVYQALLILANEYRNSRMGTGTDEGFRSALTKFGMNFSGSIDKSRAGEEGDAYYVNYPLGTDRREFLQYHIERGNSRETRYCMRIYFFWDPETSQVVVGWLPSHLSNRIS